MLGNFQKSLAVTLAYEGGWADNPKDPGGATMKGVTLKLYQKYKPGATKTALRNISTGLLSELYQKEFWSPISGDRLAAGVDLATFDAEGFCNIVGRVKDMVIRGGENVYPREVEEFLYRHPKVREVQVFGVPDRKYGEELAAWIVLKPGETATEEEIREFCQGQIAHYKIPRYVRFKETLPSGKSYAILDITSIPEDNTAPVTVPAGHLFLMGDNRDRSADSRFPAVEGQGIGLVPEENLVGHALVTMFSTDGSASWINPISWFTAARWNRAGEGF